MRKAADQAVKSRSADQHPAIEKQGLYNNEKDKAIGQQEAARFQSSGNKDTLDYELKDLGRKGGLK